MKTAATRGGRPLAPTAPPAIGDVLTIAGSPYRLARVVETGRGPLAHRVYVFADPKGRRIAVTVQKENP